MIENTGNAEAASRPLILVRHGATEPNLAGLRCGGDLDVPLTDLGREQAIEAAQRILDLDWKVGVIVASHLRRTQETAAVISRLLGGIQVVIAPAFAERRLGEWNLRSVAETESALAAGVTPPGGESAADFLDRIAEAAATLLLPQLERRPLLVGSKGVARAFRELLGMPRAKGLANGEILQLGLATLCRRDRIGCHA
jgi:probable phosphoglycerate mutase